MKQIIIATVIILSIQGKASAQLVEPPALYLPSHELARVEQIGYTRQSYAKPQRISFASLAVRERQTLGDPDIFNPSGPDVALPKSALPIDGDVWVCLFMAVLGAVYLRLKSRLRC